MGLVETQSIGERIERIDHAAAGARLGAQEHKIGPKRRVLCSNLRADPFEGAFETQTCIDADDHQIEKIRKVETKIVVQLPLSACKISIRSEYRDHECDGH